MSLPDTASEYQGVRRTYRLQGGGDVMVGPAPGHLRNTICETAAQQTVGGTFDQRYYQATSPRGSGTVTFHWCGVYATFVWLQAKMQVEWAFVANSNNNGPYKPGNNTRIETSTIKDMIAPGDIVVESTGALHHMLVLSISADGNAADVLEGNGGPGSKTQTIVRRRRSSLGSVGYFYSVDSYRWSKNYGTNIQGTR